MAGTVIATVACMVDREKVLAVLAAVLLAGCDSGNAGPSEPSGSGGMVRKAIDGTARMPDGPPLESADAAAFLLKLADNVVEAYRAIYVSAGGPEVGVWAVRFNDDALAKPDPPPGMINPQRARGFRSRSVQGATVVLVTAPSSSECVRAIDSYIRSLK